MVNQPLLNQIMTAITNGDKMNKTTVENFGKHHGVNDQNLVKETAELAVVILARKLAHQPGKTVHEKYEDIVDLYHKQVGLTHRTSQSMLLQQYSTPAPIGYLMGVFCGIDKFSRDERALEPSAGNGLLTIAGYPGNFDVNDIDKVRNEHLHTQGFHHVTQFDATTAKSNPVFNAVLTNPPFGSMVNTEYIADKYKIKGLEHYMAIKALDNMRNDGRAAIIVGGHLEFGKDGMIPAGKNRIFFAYLYRFYNVVDVINIDGSLYKKQGTSFDVRVILINGRKATPEGLPPFAKDIDSTPVKDFDTLYERFEGLIELEKKEKVVMLKKEFTFYKDSPLKKGKALPILEKRINVDGKIMTYAEWIESFSHDLKIDTAVKMHSRTSEKGYTIKMAIGNNLISSLAEIEYYKYLQNGGYPYTEFKKDEAEAKKIEDEQKAEKRRIDNIASAIKAKEDNIKNKLMFMGPIAKLEAKYLTHRYSVLKDLETKRKTEGVLEDIKREKEQIDRTKEIITKNHKLYNEIYYINNDGIPQDKFKYEIGDNAWVSQNALFIPVTIAEKKENRDGDITYKVNNESKQELYNNYQGYENLRPADYFNTPTKPDKPSNPPTHQPTDMPNNKLKLLKLKAKALLLLLDLEESTLAGMKNKPSKVVELSKEFSRILLSELGKDTMAEINKVNKTPEYKNSGACASYNYTDPNEYVLQAFEKVMNREYVFYNDEKPATKKKNETDTDLMNDAWAMAKENDFYINDKPLSGVKDTKKRFAYKDKSGRGITGKFTLAEILKWENEEDWSSNELHEWAENAEEGDVWEHESMKVTCLDDKPKEIAPDDNVW